MPERGSWKKSTKTFNLRRVWVGPVPVGEMLRKATKLADNKETQSGIRKAKDVLREKGLIILDPHHSRYDIVGSGANLAEALDFERCIIPSSFVNLERPYLRGFYNSIEKNGIELFPTYRRGSYVPKHERATVNNMDPAFVTESNYAYVDRAIEVLKEPGSVVFMAGYGGFNKPHKGNIPTGIREVLKTGNPTLCALSVYGKNILPITTYLSDNLLTFDSSSTNDQMFEAIINEHKKLAVTSGFDPKYFD